MTERTCETCSDERNCGADNRYACSTTNYKRWSAKPVEDKSAEYEKAREELRQRKSWGGLADEVIDKLEALAIAEGERRENLRMGKKIVANAECARAEGRQQAFKEVRDNLPALSGDLSGCSEDYKQGWVQCREEMRTRLSLLDKQAIDQLRKGGE